MARRWIVLVLLTGFLGLSTPAQDLDKIQLQKTRLTDHLHVISGAGGNVAVYVSEDSVFLVDSGYPGLTEKLIASIAEISDLPVTLILNTHWHFDHTGGNEMLADKGCSIVAHENVRARMAAGQKIAIIDRELPPAPKDALPSITFQDGISFHFGTEKITCFSPGPAHTDGDTIVKFESSGVVHTGDLMFNGGYPFIDISSGGGIDAVIQGVDTVLKHCKETTKIIPGHGPMATKAVLQEYRNMLVSFRDIIAREKKAGKSLEEIQEAKPTAELDAKWGATIFPPDVFTEIVFRSLPD